MTLCGPLLLTGGPLWPLAVPQWLPGKSATPHLFAVRELRADSLKCTKILYGSFINAWQKNHQEM